MSPKTPEFALGVPPCSLVPRGCQTACGGVVDRAGASGTVGRVDLREERPTDDRAVREVHEQAFGDDGSTVAELVDDLRATIPSTDGLSLVVEHDGRVVGHVMFTRSLLDAPARLVTVQVLSPLAVVPEHQRRGVGAALVRRGLAVMAERGVPAVFLEGDPEYYARFGFMPGEALGFRKPSLRIPDDAFQVIRSHHMRRG
jgi:putative acetyltransferase